MSAAGGTDVKDSIKNILSKDSSPSEHWEQATLIYALRSYWSRYPELGLIYSSLNGARVSIRTAVKLKKEGMLSGVPDLFLPVARKPYHGLYVEMKRRPYTTPKGNKVKPGPTGDQPKIIKALRDQGYKVEVATGWEEALAEVLCYIKLPKWEG